MKVVYNLIKYPLIYIMIGFFFIELVLLSLLCSIFIFLLEQNQDLMKETLISQSEEVFNSINFLINSKLNSVSNELLLFNQHINIKNNYKLNIDNFAECKISDSKIQISENQFNIEDIDKLDNRSKKIEYILNNDFLNNIALYTPNGDENNIDKKKICYSVSILKSIFGKNIINNEYLEKLNYTLYINDMILFYPFKNINDETLKKLPFFNSKLNCQYSTYTFECSSILNYEPIEENLTLQNSIIHMNLKLSNKNLYINSCINTILEENIDDKKQFFCIASNLSNILDGINYDSNYFTVNIIQYNKEKDGINLLYSSNENLYKDISLNEDSRNQIFTLFSSEEYGQYQIKSTVDENIADLFHILYYEIEKYKLSKKTKSELIEEYEQNIKQIKEFIKDNVDSENENNFNNISITVTQSYVEYKYNTSGQIDYESCNINEAEFMYILKPVETDDIKIIEGKNIIDKSFKKTIFYTLTVVKLTNPKSSLIIAIYDFITLRILFYSLICEVFIALIIYIFLFLIMRCILNPFKIFKASLEKLLDINIKNNNAKNEFNNHRKKRNSSNNFNNVNINEINNINNKNNNKDSHEVKEEKKDVKKIYYMDNYLKTTSEVKHQYTNIEMKNIEKIISFLQKILLLRDINTPYQAKAEFYQSISSEISKNYQLDLFRCQLLISEYYIKDKQYQKAKKELENFQIRLELCRNDMINKDKFAEKKITFRSTYKNTYINNYTNNTLIKNDKFISLEMITENYHYLMGLVNYFLFLDLKKEKKQLLNEYQKERRKNPSKTLSSIIAKNMNLNMNNDDELDLDYSSNNIISQMDYHLEKAIEHFKESYKINDSLKINQIKNIIILVYLAKCYLDFSNKSIEEANKVLKKAILSLSNFNRAIIGLTDSNAYNIKKKNFKNNKYFLLVKNFGILVSQVIKECYIDSRVMLIVNGSLLQLIFYQIGKMALKMHKIKAAYFCFVKLIQISYFQNENIHFKAIKWLRFILKSQIGKEKKSNGFMLQLLSQKRNNSYGSLNLGGEEEIYIKKSSIEYMKTYIKSLLEIFEKNKYKRREKKLSKELLFLLEKKIIYKTSYQRSSIKKRTRLNSRTNIFKLNQSLSLTGSNKEVSQYTEPPNIFGIDNSPSSKNNKNDKNSVSPNNNQDNKYTESISRTEYEALTKSLLIKDLLIAQIIHSPLKIREEEKIFKNIEKQYFRLNTKKKDNKCIIIILSQNFLENFSSLKSFYLFLQDCISKFLEGKDKIGYIFYSFSSGIQDKFYELEPKEKALKKLEDLFQIIGSFNKIKKPLRKKKYLTDSFDIAMDMFINEQLNNDDDSEYKSDKYIFCFGTLNSLRYHSYEASFSQTNRFNYMEISLYYFSFDSLENNKDKIYHYKKFFKKFIEGFLVFVENFKLIKLCFANICIGGKQKNLFSNKLECIKNII